MRRRALAGLEKEGSELQAQLAAPPISPNARNADAEVPRDPKKLLTRASGWLRSETGHDKVKRLFETLSNEEILAALGEVSKLELGSRRVLEEILARVLVRNDPGFALEHLISRSSERREGVTMQLESGLKMWALKDPLAAGAWFDREVEKSNFGSKRLDGRSGKRIIFETALLLGLIDADPAAAAARLAAIPEDRRGGPLNEYANQPIAAEKQLAFAKLVTESQTPEAARRILENQAAILVGVDGLSETSDFLTRIGATPEERAACAEAAANRGLTGLSYRTKITRTQVDELRTWIQSEAPEALDRATGTAIGGIGVMDFSEVAALAVAYHESSGNDDVLCAFLGSWNAKEHPAEARLLAAKIADEKRREEILRHLK